MDEVIRLHKGEEMTDKEKYEIALECLADKHCCMVDAREIREQAYCPINDSITCEECWANYIQYGDWWNHEKEPDYDRAWKEMHGE